MVHFPRPAQPARRDSQNSEAYLIGSGIAALSAALHLVKDAQMPPGNIHILDGSPDSGGGLKTQGDAMDGYFLPMDGNPHFHGECLERLLDMIPDMNQGQMQGMGMGEMPGRSRSQGQEGELEGGKRSVMQRIREREGFEMGKEKEADTKGQGQVRGVKMGENGVELFHAGKFQIAMKYRMSLVGLMMENEASMGTKKIEDVFDKEFFDTSFWMLWSSTFALQPWHSAAEFKRHLRKYLEELGSLNNVKTTHRTEYNFFESAVGPLTNYLKDQGVDFRFNTRVTDLRCYPDGDPTTISEIEMLSAKQEERITVDPTDIVIMGLGSVNTGVVFGTNKAAPPPLPATSKDLAKGDWKLWESLSQKSLKFGDPGNFLSRIDQSMASTFTTTFTGGEFPSAYERLTHDKPGTGALLSLTGSSWQMTVCIPHQPVFRDQHADITVMMGYGLNPAATGEYVQKPMTSCSGEEILREILGHMGIISTSASKAESIIDNAHTIPCSMPLATAPFLTRGHHDRPAVVPPRSTNFACVGQFVDVPGDTTLEIEYSVRGAQMAVSTLMGSTAKPPKPPRSLLMEVFDLMV
ncbi:streptococcal 67 kDa myosin-cross-reactive antigen like family-domain-containing protein [Aspergillus keveii]|uniref:Streptococcal 67 kDa myosin-cross-reactive antigen like family-domain-containing protein n=1 Tax=Aspergillus keveii TaxID=714993 RepID=A0ABR4FWX8_9EURO